MTGEMAAAAAAIAEVRRLHVALERWLSGEAGPAAAAGAAAGAEVGVDFEAEIAAALAPGFTMIQPSGALHDRSATLTMLRGAAGGSPGFRIAVEAAAARMLGPGLALVTYLERQSGARNSAAANARRSSAVLEVADPARPRWLHLHECWAEG